jgi:hypothetical protein
LDEYIENYFPLESSGTHGNTKQTKQEYVRTSPITKRNIRSELEKNKTVREIFKEQLQSEHQPCDSKKLKNIKTNIKKESNPEKRCCYLFC